MTNNPLDEALQAHMFALAMQSKMHDASAQRDQAVRNARSAGYSTREIAAHLGITQRRVQAMISNG